MATSLLDILYKYKNIKEQEILGYKVPSKKSFSDISSKLRDGGGGGSKKNMGGTNIRRHY